MKYLKFAVFFLLLPAASSAQIGNCIGPDALDMVHPATKLVRAELDQRVTYKSYTECMSESHALHSVCAQLAVNAGSADAQQRFDSAIRELVASSPDAAEILRKYRLCIFP